MRWVQWTSMISLPVRYKAKTSNSDDANDNQFEHALTPSVGTLEYTCAGSVVLNDKSMTSLNSVFSTLYQRMPHCFTAEELDGDQISMLCTFTESKTHAKVEFVTVHMAPAIPIKSRLVMEYQLLAVEESAWYLYVLVTEERIGN